MSKHGDDTRFFIINPQGGFVGITEAPSAFEAQFKLAEGLLYPLTECGNARELIKADVVAAIWRVAERAGWRVEMVGVDAQVSD